MALNDKKKGDLIFAPSPVTDIDAIGFSLRLQGIQIRDCISCQGSEERPFTLVGTVPSDQTFLEGVLRRGNGVLDIDGARVSMSSNDFKKTQRTGDYDGSTPGMFGVGVQMRQPVSPDGRFPANLIFKHSEGCRCEGTKKVKGITGTAAGKMKRSVKDSQVYGLRKKDGDSRWSGANDAGKITGYVSEDGKEEVANWICEPSCPVRALDGQSGTLKSGKDINPTKESVSGFFGNTMGFYSKEANYGDSGGASRFFQQVQSEEELEDYLEVLIRKGKFK